MPKKRSVLLYHISQSPILALLFVASCILLVKNAGLVQTNLPVLHLLNAPVGYWAKVANLVDIFTGAYATGILFLFLVEQIPAEKKRRAAMASIFPAIQSLYLYICDLTEMFRIASAGGSVDNIIFTDDPVYVEVSIDGRFDHLETFSLVSTSINRVQNILQTIAEISGAPMVESCDERLLAILSALKTDGNLAKVFPSGLISGGCVLELSKTYKVLTDARDTLDELYSGLMREGYTVISKEEFKDYQRAALKHLMEALGND